MSSSMIDYQLFLLSRMRAKAKIEQALSELGVTQEQMHKRSKLLETTMLENHQGAVYVDLLGSPVHVDNSIKERILQHFELPLWPNFWLEVPIQGNGLAERVSFVRKPTAIIPKQQDELIKLQAWCHTRDEVLKMYPTLELTEAWAWWEEYKPADSLSPFVVFDWNLLQLVDDA